jgi:hypothetical protein
VETTSSYFLVASPSTPSSAGVQGAGVFPASAIFALWMKAVAFIQRW